MSHLYDDDRPSIILDGVDAVVQKDPFPLPPPPPPPSIAPIAPAAPAPAPASTSAVVFESMECCVVLKQPHMKSKKRSLSSQEHHSSIEVGHGDTCISGASHERTKRKQIKSHESAMQQDLIDYALHKHSLSVVQTYGNGKIRLRCRHRATFTRCPASGAIVAVQEQGNTLLWQLDVAMDGQHVHDDLHEHRKRGLPLSVQKYLRLLLENNPDIKPKQLRAAALNACRGVKEENVSLERVRNFKRGFSRQAETYISSESISKKQ